MQTTCNDVRVDVAIKIISDPGGGQLERLATWLRAERDLHGRVELVREKIGQESLGGALDVLSVAVGSGGIGVALAQSLSAWLRSRRTDIKMVISCENRRIEIDARRVSDPNELISRILQISQREDAG